jgi:hypothetical protein
MKSDFWIVFHEFVGFFLVFDYGRIVTIST